jgi:hypothetical protein
MAAVYENATLVIGAASAADSTQGFLNHRNFHEGPLLGDESKYFLREKITSRKDQTSSPLSSRAWAYRKHFSLHAFYCMAAGKCLGSVATASKTKE